MERELVLVKIVQASRRRSLRWLLEEASAVRAVEQKGDAAEANL